MIKLKLKDTYNDSIGVSYSRYSIINKLYLKFLIKKVLEGHKVALPYRMGTLEVIGRKPKYNIDGGVIKGLAPNWKATREYRITNPDSTKVIFHTNPNTDGYRYKVKWSKFNVYAKYKKYYSLRLIRDIKRTLSSIIKEDHSRYKTL